jgi:hypothetical protein
VARKFLYLFAILIVIVIAAAAAYRLFPQTVMRMALVPSTRFEELAPGAKGYDDPSMWIARPGLAADKDPSLWMPRLPQPGLDPAEMDRAAKQAAPRLAVEGTRGDAAIFFIHPTSYLERTHWNAPLDDEEANWRAELFTRGMASALAGAGQVWAPRYRQAAMGAFLTQDVDTANRALNAAYGDVLAAFDQFLAEVKPNQPIILAGHSQGSLHLARLLRERVAGRPLAQRIVAAYVVGWPISVAHDLPAMGLPACADADSSNCILGWQSFAEPADPAMILTVYDATIGFDGQSRRGSRALCVNPISGVLDGEAPASANLGTVRADADFADGTIIQPGLVGAACDKDRGFLLIGTGPDLGGYLLPGNNYHVFDYPLFWSNVRADAIRRLDRFEHRRR